MSESSGVEDDDEFYDACDDGEDEADSKIIYPSPCRGFGDENTRTLTDKFATCLLGDLQVQSHSPLENSVVDVSILSLPDDDSGDHPDNELDISVDDEMPSETCLESQSSTHQVPNLNHVLPANTRKPNVRSRNEPKSLEDLTSTHDSLFEGYRNDEEEGASSVGYQKIRISTSYLKSSSLPLERDNLIGNTKHGLERPCSLFRTLDRMDDGESIYSGTSTTSQDTKSHSEHSSIIRLPKKNLVNMYSKLRRKTRPNSKLKSPTEDAHVPGSIPTAPDQERPGSEFTSCASPNFPIDRKKVFCNSRIVQTFKPQVQVSVWCLKFSPCGKYLAAAGQDKMVRVWILRTEEELVVNRTSPTSTSTNSLKSTTSAASSKDYDQLCSPFYNDPYRMFSNHSSDIMDISWSHNSLYLLSASMDKSVRLWHLPTNKCMGKFDHQNIVTCVAFPPASETDDVFISGAMDGKVRKWSIPMKKVISHYEVTGGKKQPITCVNYNNKGDMALVGTLNGCIIKITKDLKEVICLTRTTTSKGKQKKNPIKIVSIQENPGESDVYLVSSSDCRIRLYDTGLQSVGGTPDRLAGSWRLKAKYKGHTNKNCPIRSGFNRLGNYVMSGSECNGIFIWSTEPATPIRPKDTSFECISAHDVSVTAATFCPTNEPIRCADDCEKKQSDEWRSLNSRFKRSFVVAEVFASADFTGTIHVFFV